MRSHSIYEFHSAAAQTATALPRTSLATVISIAESPAFVRTVENPQKSDADGLACVRGFRAAFLLEGGLVLLGYGVWLLWHLFH